MSLLSTPAKRIIKESVLGVKLKEEFEDLESIFHSASGGGVSITSAPNGQDPNSRIVIMTGPAATASPALSPNGIDHKRFMDELRYSLLDNHYKLVSFQYHEDPASNAVTAKCFVKIPRNL
jgi:hypothetical protein